MAFLQCFPLDPPTPLRRPSYSDIMLDILLIEQTVAIYVYQARLLAVLWLHIQRSSYLNNKLIL